MIEKWLYGNRIEPGLIREFEKTNSFTFPQEFVCVVMENNYDRPLPNSIDSVRGKELSIKALLSFIRTDIENIWDFTEILLNNGTKNRIPFAIDDFGNLFCFDTNMNIFLLDFDENVEISICQSFEQLMKNLK